MNAGLSNLATLKQFLLAAGLQASAAYDLKLQVIGAACAAMVDTYCNRQFEFAAGYQEIFTGDRPHYYLKLFPLAVVQEVDMRYFLTDNWTNITGIPIQWNQQTGLIAFGFTLGRFPLQIRAVYSGGYFYETLEPQDGGYPSAAPSGVDAQGNNWTAPPLPPDVQGAWLLLCQEVWNKMDKLGAGITGPPDTLVKTGMLDMPPIVKMLLNPYKRYQLT